MAQNKTQPTDEKVSDYLSGIANETRRNDCQTLARMMSRITDTHPTMWGPSIVGFGRYHYTYESGREGDAPLAGFSSRKDSISVYLTASGEHQTELLEQLGRHKMAKACLYIRTLDDVDLSVLERLIIESVEEVKRRYPAGGA